MSTGHLVRPDGTIKTEPHKPGNANGLQKRLRELYLEYVNDHLTVSHIAEYYGLDPVDMDQLIHIGRKLHQEFTSHE